MKKLAVMIIILVLLLAGCTPGREECMETEDIWVGATTAKPVIYLYPEEETVVTVKLDYDGVLTVTYPAYQDGWRVLARPDGTLTDLETGLEYSYLFWEGERAADYDMSRGFVVRGEDTAAFFAEDLGGDGTYAPGVQRVHRILAAPDAGKCL